eukprot:Phypoly_transcript_00304.p1 GENE.Phypoly_transcript_00304~~Phypoly_transcript_00304.p1  ORF type:complete len:1325 (-),score=309.44 Phypoly_transcript_00304:1341-5315(-)
MEAWDNDRVVAWLASKGFGVWTPYFKVQEIDGKALVCLSLDQLLEAKVDKSSAKKIILKRDRQLKRFQNNPYATCYPSANNSDSDTPSASSSRRPSNAHDSDSSQSTQPTNTSSNLPLQNTLSTNDQSTNISIPSLNLPPTSSSANNLSSSLSSPERNAFYAHPTSLSHSSLLLPNANLQSSVGSHFGTSPLSTSPLGTSPDTLIQIEADNGDKKRNKGKKKKKGKKPKKGKEKKSLSSSTYNADDDASDSQSDGDLSDETEGVGAPYNVSHHLHVEYHADIGFTGLPPEWRARFEDEVGFPRESLSPYPLTWTADNVAVWMGNLGFGVYVAAFKKEQVDGKRLVGFHSAEALRNVFPQITDKHALAIHKQIDILKGSFPKSGKKLDKIFGIPLDAVMQAQRLTHPDIEIPIVLHKMYSFIRERGMNHMGIFRIGPSVAQTQEIRDKIDETMDVNLADFPDCIIPTSLIKLYLRELPHPIITHEIYSSCLSAVGKDISVMKQCLESLPLDNYALLKHTLWLLYDVSLHKEVNQMGADNLAKVIGPTLLWKNAISEGIDRGALALVQMATAFVEMCISSFPKLFLTENSVPAIPREESETSLLFEPTPRTGEGRELAKTLEIDHILDEIPVLQFEEVPKPVEIDSDFDEVASLEELAKPVEIDSESDEVSNATLEAESESTSRYGADSRNSRLSESASSVTSAETMILHSSYDSSVPGTPSSSQSSGFFNFALNSGPSSLSSSSSSSTTDSIVLDELIIAGQNYKLSNSSDSSAPSTPTTVRERIKPPHSPYPPAESPPSSAQRTRSDSKENSIERTKTNSKENLLAERGRANSREHPPSLKEHRRDNSRDAGERTRSNSKEQLPSPSSLGIERERAQTLPFREHKRENSKDSPPTSERTHTHKRENSKDQSPPTTERIRSNSKEHTGPYSAPNSSRDRSNSRENSIQERERSHSNSDLLSSPKTRERASTIDSLRASPRGPTLGLTREPSQSPFRVSPRELRLRKDTLSIIPKEGPSSPHSPHSANDPPTPRGTPNKPPDVPHASRTPLQVLPAPATFPAPSPEDEPPAKTEPLQPPPHLWPLPNSSTPPPLSSLSSLSVTPSFSISLPPSPPVPPLPSPSSSPPQSPTPAPAAPISPAQSHASPAQGPSPAQDIASPELGSLIPPPPPDPPGQFSKSPRTGEQNLLRRLTLFLPKEKEKDKEKEEEDEKEEKEKEKDEEPNTGVPSPTSPGSTSKYATFSEFIQGALAALGGAADLQQLYNYVAEHSTEVDKKYASRFESGTGKSSVGYKSNVRSTLHNNQCFVKRADGQWTVNHGATGSKRR